MFSYARATEWCLNHGNTQGREGLRGEGVIYRSAHAAFLGRGCGADIAARHVPTGS